MSEPADTRALCVRPRSQDSARLSIWRRWQRRGQQLLIGASLLSTVMFSTSVAVCADAPPTSARQHVHVVSRGETLYGIARRYGVLVRALVDANPTLKNTSGNLNFRVGQRLVVPGIFVTEADTAVSMRRSEGIYVVPVEINGAMSLDFVVDSGASDVAIPEDVFRTLVRTGTVSRSDITGTQEYQLADGTVSEQTTFKIRKLRVGRFVLKDVTASVAPIDGVLLLGQSFLQRFSSWSIDNAQHRLILEGAPNDVGAAGSQ